VNLFQLFFYPLLLALNGKLGKSQFQFLESFFHFSTRSSVLIAAAQQLFITSNEQVLVKNKEIKS
jgi:hypothetical protein